MYSIFKLDELAKIMRTVSSSMNLPCEEIDRRIAKRKGKSRITYQIGEILVKVKWTTSGTEINVKMDPPSELVKIITVKIEDLIPIEMIEAKYNVSKLITEKVEANRDIFIGQNELDQCKNFLASIGSFEPRYFENKNMIYSLPVNRQLYPRDEIYRLLKLSSLTIGYTWEKIPNRQRIRAKVGDVEVNFHRRNRMFKKQQDLIITISGKKSMQNARLVALVFQSQIPITAIRANMLKKDKKLILEADLLNQSRQF